MDIVQTTTTQVQNETVDGKPLDPFHLNLKAKLLSIPVTSDLLKDLNFNSSYSGLRTFLHNRKTTPSGTFMDTLSDKLGYDYIRVPVKRGTDRMKMIEECQEDFFKDLDTYSMQFNRTGTTKNISVLSQKGGSSVSQAIASFNNSSVIDIDLDELF